MFNPLRQAVSLKKRRFRADGFNLDLAYITNRVIAMGYPSAGMESLYRNPATDVVRFLTQRHSNKFRVYNLCSESDRQYDASLFDGRVARYPFADHQCPPLSLVQDAVHDMERWLAMDEEHVVVIHCKAGKGRTGLLVCCLLLHLEHEGLVDADGVMEYYGHMRTLDGKGLTIPSQRRFVKYYETVQRGRLPGSGSVTLRRVRLAPPPLHVNAADIVLAIEVNGDTVFSSAPGSARAVTVAAGAGAGAGTGALAGAASPAASMSTWSTAALGSGSAPLSAIDIALPGVVLAGTLLVTLWDSARRRELCHMWLHTAFFDSASVRIGKSEIDRAFKDKKCAMFPASFFIELAFVRDAANVALSSPAKTRTVFVQSPNRRIAPAIMSPLVASELATVAAAEAADSAEADGDGVGADAGTESSADNDDKASAHSSERPPADDVRRGSEASAERAGRASPSPSEARRPAVVAFADGSAERAPSPLVASAVADAPSRPAAPAAEPAPAPTAQQQQQQQQVRVPAAAQPAVAVPALAVGALRNASPSRVVTQTSPRSPQQVSPRITVGPMASVGLVRRPSSPTMTAGGTPPYAAIAAAAAAAAAAAVAANSGSTAPPPSAPPPAVPLAFTANTSAAASPVGGTATSVRLSATAPAPGASWGAAAAAAGTPTRQRYASASASMDSSTPPDRDAPHPPPSRRAPQPPGSSGSTGAAGAAGATASAVEGDRDRPVRAVRSGSPVSTGSRGSGAGADRSVDASLSPPTVRSGTDPRVTQRASISVTRMSATALGGVHARDPAGVVMSAPTVTGSATGRLMVTWLPPQQATGAMVFRLHRTTQSAADKLLADSVVYEGPSMCYWDSDVAPGVGYVYAVSALLGDAWTPLGERAQYNCRGRTPPVPGVPRAAKVAPTSVTVEWDMPEGDPMPNRFRLFCSDAVSSPQAASGRAAATDLGSPIYEGTLRRFTQRGLVPGVKYCFAVAAGNGDAFSPLSPALVVQTPVSLPPGSASTDAGSASVSASLRSSGMRQV